MSWDGLSEWWIDEIGSDPAYEEVVDPLIRRLLGEGGGRRLLDVGCGEGRIMTAAGELGWLPLGVDVDADLIRLAAAAGPVVRGRLPRLPLADRAFDGAVLSLVLEHVPDHVTLLRETARVLRPHGVLVVVLNHPIFTAPESGPIVDPEDDETLWRPGRYFDHGYTEEPAGSATIRFYHRSMGALLSDAAAAGLFLEEMIELGPDEGQIERTPVLARQRHIPRLLGIRWRKLSGVPGLS